MSVRSSHSRAAKTYKIRTINGVSVYFTWEWDVSLSQASYRVKKAEQGKLQIPEGATACHLKADKTAIFGKCGDSLARFA